MGSNSGLKNRINYSIFIMLLNVATHKKCNENAPYILIPCLLAKPIRSATLLIRQRLRALSDVLLEVDDVVVVLGIHET